MLIEIEKELAKSADYGDSIKALNEALDRFDNFKKLHGTNDWLTLKENGASKALLDSLDEIYQDVIVAEERAEKIKIRIIKQYRQSMDIN